MSRIGGGESIVWVLPPTRQAALTWRHPHQPERGGQQGAPGLSRDVPARLTLLATAQLNSSRGGRVRLHPLAAAPAAAAAAAAPSPSLLLAQLGVCRGAAQPLLLV